MKIYVPAPQRILNTFRFTKSNKSYDLIPVIYSQRTTKVDYLCLTSLSTIILLQNDCTKMICINLLSTLYILSYSGVFSSTIKDHQCLPRPIMLKKNIEQRQISRANYMHLLSLDMDAREPILNNIGKTLVTHKTCIGL